MEDQNYKQLYDSVKDQVKLEVEYAKLNPEDIKMIENCTTSLIRVAAA